MTVKVYYRVECQSKEIEVDDKFEALTVSGGYFDLSIKEKNKLTQELYDDVNGTLSDGEELDAVWDEKDEEVLIEL